MATAINRFGVRGRRGAGRLRRGAAVVEMAVVTPLLLMLIFGIMEFGWVFMMEQTITNATREATRVAILQGSTDTDVRTRFSQAMAPTGITVDTNMLTITRTTGENPVVTVSASMPYSRVSLVGNLLGLNLSKMVGSSCSMRAEG
jgi:Flp pilus assembly protein TadG